MAPGGHSTPQVATFRTAAPSDLCRTQFGFGGNMLGSRAFRIVRVLLLLIPVAFWVGCMGLTGQNNNQPPTTTNPTPPPTNNPTPPPPAANPTATITVSPSSVESGSKVMVSWQTQNANSISLSQNGQTVQLDGNPLSSQGMPFTLNVV